MADLCERKIEEDKTDSLLSNKLLKILIEDKNMETLLEPPTLKVRVFL